ncbi:DUF4136 domain-containing protein [Steroidobacter cummioxidans]|uniref:DUF4136 domain-containing protein n=1 Tax=Steroidobacter cummioxidans TaxID=1803913 RepID=UPI000E31E208|nr:DUF4136 domain-containing protein [Steroidobacter cummioxidans]
MMRTRFARLASRIGAAALFAVSLTCLAQSINTNYMPGTDFSKYHTYRWVSVGEHGAVDPILDQQIKQAVDKQLQAKSLVKKDEDPADLYIGYQVGVQQEHELNAYGSPGWRFGGGMANATTSTVDNGTLVLDMYDPAMKQLVWRGGATETIDKNSSEEKKQKQLDKAATKLLKNFPPKAAK